MPANGRGLQRAFLAAGLLLAVAFVARRQHLPPAQLMPLALALLVPCTFAARELLIGAGRSRRPGRGAPGQEHGERDRDGRAPAHALKLDPQPQVVVAFGLLNTKPRPMISSLKSIVVPLRYR